MNIFKKFLKALAQFYASTIVDFIHVANVSYVSAMF